MAVTGEAPAAFGSAQMHIFVSCVKAGASCPVQDAEGTLPLFLWLYLPRVVSAGVFITHLTLLVMAKGYIS